MHKAILIDDEALARQLLKHYLKDFTNVEVIAECTNGFEGFKAIQELKPDLIFLDVQMPKLNGFEMLELLDERPAVIFSTAFDEYALKAFEANALDYLLKPIQKERFDKAIQKWLLNAEKKPETSIDSLPLLNAPEGYTQRIVVKDQSKIRIIPWDEINYIEANDDYVKIVTPAGNFLKKATLSQLEMQLEPEQFVRVHRSYIVPVEQIVRIEPYEKDSHIALLQCGTKVSVSKTGMTKLKNLLNW
jgi:two-component system LytT family response regulator